jgi:hypothetical protein
MGTGVTTWSPVTDKDGNVQTLNIGALGAGASSFPESQQNSPPAAAGVKWHIPPLAPGEVVNHFCLRATVTCSNDVNPHNNVVQSNIAYVPYTPAVPFRLHFMAGNPTRVEIPLELAVEAALPGGWSVKILAENDDVRLKPGEELTLPLEISMAPDADRHLEPPFDGWLRGELFGSLSGPFEGGLNETTWDGEHLRGHLSARLDDLGTLSGSFEGSMDQATGQVEGRLLGAWQCDGGRERPACVGLRGCLRPLRRVNVQQLVNGRAIGGLTIQVQVPMRAGPCAYPLPPTEPWVKSG